MTPPDINIKRHAESQREVQINVSLKRSCHFSFLFYLNYNIYLIIKKIQLYFSSGV